MKLMVTIAIMTKNLPILLRQRNQVNLQKLLPVEVTVLLPQASSQGTYKTSDKETK
jgi:hypothetical protein